MSKCTKTQRRRVYPMPVEGIFDHPLFEAMPCAGAGILFRLCRHFWMTECKSVPIQDDELRAITRAHGPTWRRWRTDVMTVFGDVRPELEAYFRARELKLTAIKFAAHRGAATTASRATRFSRPALVSNGDAREQAGAALTQNRKAARQYGTPGSEVEEKEGRIRFREKV